MPAAIAIILLGIIQGLTEFLPVSSSGHLTLFQYFSKDFKDDLSINIAVHMGTLLTVLIYYRHDLTRIITGIFKREPDSLRMAGEILLASVPTALIGLSMKKFAEGLLTSPLVTGFGLLVTGSFLLASSRFTPKDQSSGMTVGYKNAFIIGVIQGIAVLPGISRSGSTIVGGLGLGLTPSKAARFSFLLSIPAVAGAGLLEFLGAESKITGETLALAATVSCLVGLFAITATVRLTQKGKLKPFGYYVLIVGVTFLTFYFLGMGEDIL